MRAEPFRTRNFIDGQFVEPIPFLSFRAKSRNEASGTSDIDGCAARVAARESGDERVNSGYFYVQLGIDQMLFSIRNFIDGQFVEPVSGKYLDNIEPATGKPYSQVSDSDAHDVDLAVAAADKAFRDWSKKPASDRSRFCCASQT